jgi:uncharacterized protein YciI
MWFVCLRRALRPRDQWTESVDSHLEWMRTQHEAGKVLLSGPGSLKGERYGIYLIRAASRAEAEQIAAADPFTAAGDCAFDLIEWEVHQIMGAGPFSSAAFPPGR